MWGSVTSLSVFLEKPAQFDWVLSTSHESTVSALTTLDLYSTCEDLHWMPLRTSKSEVRQTM